MLSKIRVNVLTALLTLWASGAYGFDTEDYVLILPGHTNTLSVDHKGEPVLTCDFKSLDGKLPETGEPCDGSPRLFIPRQDLQSLRYISQAFDNSEMVKRAYERFDKIAFIMSPDFEYPWGQSPYGKEAQEVSVRPPGVSKRDYDYFADRALDLLTTYGEGRYEAVYFFGITLPPYLNDHLLGVDPTTYPERPLADHCLMFLPKNPDRTTILHELFHCLIEKATLQQISHLNRYIELVSQESIRSYLLAKVLGDNLEKSIKELGEDVVAAYQLTAELYRLNSNFLAVASELEVAYFFSRFGKELGLSQHGIENHWNDFWIMAERYKNNLSLNQSKGHPPPAIWAVRENRDFVVDEQVYANYFANISAAITILAASYQRNLLGSEFNPAPGTLMEKFLRDVGPRSETQTYELPLKNVPGS